MGYVEQSKLLKIFIGTTLLVVMLSSVPVIRAFPKRAGKYLPSVDEMIIPTCINVTVLEENSEATEFPVNISNPSDPTGQKCYPLSSFFQECIKKWLGESDYNVTENHTLVDMVSGRTHPFGSYYINPEGFALTCYTGKKCNYLTLQQDEYKIMDKSLHLKLLNKTLNNATYTIDPITKANNVCYPLSQNFISCSKWLLERNEFQIAANKMLYNKASGKYHDPGEYMLLKNKRAVECISIELEKEPAFDVYTIHAAVHIISVICLAVTIVVHIILPDLSYQRAPLLCHAFSLMVTYICLAARKFNPQIENDGCYVIFYTTYFFCLASFCWLSVLAFDIWRISAHLRKGTDGYSWVNTFCNKKMMLYSIFGWCVPLLFIIIVAIIDSHDNVQDLLELYPRISNMCWFNEKPSTYAFLFGPMCLLLVLNFVCFVLSVFNIYMSSTKNAEFTNMKLNKQLLIICFIVFLAMGLFWIMEVVQYGTIGNTIEWIVPDLINGSQGIIIAAVYTCQPQAWRRLREKASKQTVLKR